MTSSPLSAAACFHASMILCFATSMQFLVRLRLRLGLGNRLAFGIRRLVAGSVGNEGFSHLSMLGQDRAAER